MVRTRAAGAARLHSHAGAWERENGREIVLKKTAPRNMETAGRISGTVIQALRWMGKNAVDDT